MHENDVPKISLKVAKQLVKLLEENPDAKVMIYRGYGISYYYLEDQDLEVDEEDIIWVKIEDDCELEFDE